MKSIFSLDISDANGIISLQLMTDNVEVIAMFSPSVLDSLGPFDTLWHVNAIDLDLLHEKVSLSPRVKCVFIVMTAVVAIRVWINYLATLTYFN